MKRLIPAVALAVVSAAGIAGAQDQKDQKDRAVTTRTEVEVDDGRAITMTGCLMQSAGQMFSLRAASVVSSEEVTTTTRVEKDIDDDGTEVRRSAKVDTDHDDAKPVGTSGLVATYDLIAPKGVDLASHVGKQVQVTAVSLDPKGGDDDAEVEIEEKTRIQREDAPDSEAKTRTEIEVPRGAKNQVTVVSVKPLGSSCAAQ
jgi:hypothetical protein